MALEGQYNAKLLEELLVKHLKSGTIPTVQALTDELAEMVAVTPELGQKPLFSLEDGSVEFYENSSASKTNQTLDRYSRDVKIMWETIVEARGRIVKDARHWATAYESMRRYLDKLEDRIDNLLLLNSDTLGYYQFVSDDFSTTSFIDLEQTTAEIDTGNRTVTIGQLTSQESLDSKIDLSHLTDSHFKFSVTEANKFQSSGLAVDSKLSYAVSDEYTTWLSYVRAEEQGPVTGSLTIDLASLQTVNKIVYKINGSTATSAFSISVLYSTDGVDFLLIPTDGHTQSTNNTATFIFTDLEVRYFKFLITKTGPDDREEDSYIYEIGAKNISFYASTYAIDAAGEIISIPLSVLDDEGNPIEFQKAVLSVCEQVPPDTSIHYLLGIDDGTSFIAIDPIEHKTPSRPQVLDFAESVFLSNADATTVMDSTLDSKAVMLDSLPAYVVDGETLLNFFIASSNVAQLDEASVTVFRNVGDFDDRTLTVRGVSRGWSYDSVSGTYSSIVRVDLADGLSIDLGTTTMYVDDIAQTGTYTLTKGIHSIRTSSVNFLNVAAGLTSLSDLKTNDLLYPYNHKLLIEGYEYDSAFEEEELYLGVALWTEATMTFTPVHTFQTQVLDTELYTYTYDVDDNGNLVFLVYTDRSFSDQGNEHFLVEYKLKNKTFTNVVLKAILTSTNPSITPVFEGYTIKLG